MSTLTTQEKMDRGTCTIEGAGRGFHSCRKAAVATYTKTNEPNKGYVALRCRWHDRIEGDRLRNNGFARVAFTPGVRVATAPGDRLDRRHVAARAAVRSRVLRAGEK